MTQLGDDAKLECGGRFTNGFTNPPPPTPAELTKGCNKLFAVHLQ